MVALATTSSTTRASLGPKTSTCRRTRYIPRPTLAISRHRRRRSSIIIISSSSSINITRTTDTTRRRTWSTGSMKTGTRNTAAAESTLPSLHMYPSPPS
ncbi:hypothetical protein FBU59_006060 [Linderina macrospora]|uniref:Uncharacterized protein n=1 Tax=Linderina macrospora TaxID=4868 RepID=A0ACC1J0U2_9FUNG|nr:hypothetical protein FBU59_006060 [Linderina macrospora]